MDILIFDPLQEMTAEKLSHMLKVTYEVRGKKFQQSFYGEMLEPCKIQENIAHQLRFETIDTLKKICDLSSVSALSPVGIQRPRSDLSAFVSRQLAQFSRIHIDVGRTEAITGPSMSKAAKPRRCDSVANSSPPTVRVLS